MNERVRREQAVQMLTALVDASEGHLLLGCCGIVRAYSDDAMNLWLELEDGRSQVAPEQVAVQALEEAIYQWRGSNAQLFQRILGAMM